MKHLAISLFLLPLSLLPASDPVLIAHRGLLRHAPENTIPAFASCLNLGMGFELDIRTTKDGKLVVLHDSTLGRTTNGANRPLTELLAEFELFEESFAFDQSEECSRRLKQLDPRIRIGRNVGRGELQIRLDENLIDVFLLSFVPTPEEVALLRKRGKQILYNYAGTGEHRRNESNWLGAREVGIDGMLTDYPLDCALLWRTTERKK